jgi:hypothetical protein
MKRREIKMREWKEIGGVMLTDSGANLLMRVNLFKDSSAEVKSIDVLLKPDELYEMLNMIKSHLQNAINDKICAVCKYHGYYSCQHPDIEVSGYVCGKEGRKYFKPRFEL